MIRTGKAYTAILLLMSSSVANQVDIEYQSKELSCVVTKLIKVSFLSALLTVLVITLSNGQGVGQMTQKPFTTFDNEQRFWDNWNEDKAVSRKLYTHILENCNGKSVGELEQRMIFYSKNSDIFLLLMEKEINGGLVIVNAIAGKDNHWMHINWDSHNEIVKETEIKTEGLIRILEWDAQNKLFKQTEVSSDKLRKFKELAKELSRRLVFVYIDQFTLDGTTGNIFLNYEGEVNRFVIYPVDLYRDFLDGELQLNADERLSRDWVTFILLGELFREIQLLENTSSSELLKEDSLSSTSKKQTKDHK